MFFLSISIMLFFSTGIITYTGLFHSREGAFLLSTPATTDRIFAYKFAESVAISSWGFFLLGIPLMAAYGLDVKAPAAFYAMFLIYLLMFVLIAGSLGAIVAIVVANVFPKRQKGVLAAGVITIAGPFRCAGGSPLANARATRLLATGWATFKTGWPSARTRSGRAGGCRPGLLASARGEWSRSGYYLMVLSAHAALAYLAAAAVARDLYFRGYSRVQGSRSSRRRRWFHAVDEVFHRLFFFVPRADPPAAAQRPAHLLPRPGPVVAVPDLLRAAGVLFPEYSPARVRRSEPILAQHGQLPEPLGHSADPLDVHQPVHFPAAFAGRPEFLGAGPAAARAKADPLGEVRVLGGNLAAGDRGARVSLSDLMLGMGPVMIALHLAMVAVLCAGLSGISVGLGARLPNLRETDPSKIAVGFGGTLNLLVSLVYIFAIVTRWRFPATFTS